MNKKVIFIFLSLFCILLSSCKTKEETVIDKLTSLYERVDKDGSNYNKNQWEEVFNELEAIHSEAKECNFTQEQSQQVGELQGKITSLIARKGIRALGNSLLNRLQNLGSFTRGLQQGAQGN